MRRSVFFCKRVEGEEHSIDLKLPPLDADDEKGDVIVGGWVNGSGVGFVELKKGAKSVRDFTLNESSL